MKLKINDKVYDTPSNVKIHMSNGQELMLRYTRVDYYPVAYGDGECVHLDKVISAALKEEVQIELISDSTKIVAKAGDVDILIPNVKADKPKKKKTAKVAVETAEIKTETDPQSTDSDE